MSKRKKCINHQWVPVNKRSILEACVNCDEVFPCQDLCGHLDCEEAYGKPPVCYVCNKRLRGNVRHYVEKRGGILLPTHEKCAKDEIILEITVIDNQDK